MACFFPPKISFSFGILWLSLFVVIKSEEQEGQLSACEIERLLKPILSPPDERTIQAQALRQRLINLLRQGFEEQVDNGIEEKRPMEKWDDFAVKRNLQALARAGYLKPLSSEEDEDENDPNFKRSTQYPARNGQDFSRDEPKRSISSLARNGELHNRRQDIEELLDELYEKRNIGSLARDFNFPTYGKRFLGSLARSGDLGSKFEEKRNLASVVRNGKRNLASLVRSNSLPAGYDEYKRNIASLARDGGKIVGKRNVAALLRQDNYLNGRHYQHEPDQENPTDKAENDVEETESKRNLPSVKAGYKPKYKRSVPDSVMFAVRRNKRQADYYDIQNEEYPQPVYQNTNNMDYEELIHALTGAYPAAEKRFLGRLPQMGKPKTTPTPKVRRRKISDFY